MASIISTNITPPPDRSGIQFAFELPGGSELDTMLCHPEMAPQAMVTNMIGQSGPILMENPV